MRSSIDAIEERIRETDWMLDGLPDEVEHDASGLHLCSQEGKQGVHGSHLISLTATKPERLLSPGGCASPPFRPDEPFPGLLPPSWHPPPGPLPRLQARPGTTTAVGTKAEDPVRMGMGTNPRSGATARPGQVRRLRRPRRLAGSPPDPALRGRHEPARQPRAPMPSPSHTWSYEATGSSLKRRHRFLQSRPGTHPPVIREKKCQKRHKQGEPRGEVSNVREAARVPGDRPTAEVLLGRVLPGGATDPSAGCAEVRVRPREQVDGAEPGSAAEVEGAVT
jgi:hypothetical protein